MNNTERFTLELAKKLDSKQWCITDDDSYLRDDLSNIQQLLDAVKGCAHILLKDDLETRIERARKELQFLEGFR
jgi:hypothetical protein